MAIEYTVNQNVGSPSGSLGSGIKKTAGSSVELEETIPASSTDLELAIAFEFANIKAILIESNKALTLETNDGTSPSDIITLVANQPLLWYEGSYFDNPFTANVTAIFVTEGAGDEATLKIRVLHDPS